MIGPLYAIINRETGEIVRDKTYTDVRHAKSAVRYHFRGQTHLYGIGIVERSAKLAWYVDDNDNWAEVTAE